MGKNAKGNKAKVQNALKKSADMLEAADAMHDSLQRAFAAHQRMAQNMEGAMGDLEEHRAKLNEHVRSMKALARAAQIDDDYDGRGAPDDDSDADDDFDLTPEGEDDALAGQGGQTTGAEGKPYARPGQGDVQVQDPYETARSSKILASYMEQANKR